MLFQSSEIRWWPTEKEKLSKQFALLPGNEIREPERTDFYLKNSGPNTGIKIREGNHELKVKSWKDELLAYGVMEHWIKWSHPAEKNILNTIKQDLLTDWVAVRKRRWKKTYEIIDSEKTVPASNTFWEEGCGVEFTEVYFPALRKTLFSLNNFYSLLMGLDSLGYPEMLERVHNDKLLK